MRTEFRGWRSGKRALWDLQQDYDAIDEVQEAESADVALRAGIADYRAITFIPTVIARYSEFWKRLPE